ncbi:unnamed protein product [Ectocarpus sp. CCAP 1310/34]|nr:unnamed protein product [Ectocarpus sp. CCAP 1310/34]
MLASTENRPSGNSRGRFSADQFGRKSESEDIAKLMLAASREEKSAKIQTVAQQQVAWRAYACTTRWHSVSRRPRLSVVPCETQSVNSSLPMFRLRRCEHLQKLQRTLNDERSSRQSTEFKHHRAKSTTIRIGRYLDSILNVNQELVAAGTPSSLTPTARQPVPRALGELQRKQSIRDSYATPRQNSALEGDGIDIRAAVNEALGVGRTGGDPVPSLAALYERIGFSAIQGEDRHHGGAPSLPTSPRRARVGNAAEAYRSRYVHDGEDYGRQRLVEPTAAGGFFAEDDTEVVESSRRQASGHHVDDGGSRPANGGKHHGIGNAFVGGAVAAKGYSFANSPLVRPTSAAERSPEVAKRLEALASQLERERSDVEQWYKDVVHRDIMLRGYPLDHRGDRCVMLRLMLPSTLTCDIQLRDRYGLQEVSQNANLRSTEQVLSLSSAGKGLFYAAMSSAACMVRRRVAWGGPILRRSVVATVAPKRTNSSGNTAAATTRPPLLLSFKRGKYKLKLPLQDGRVVFSAERDTAFSFHPNHSLETVKANIQEEGVSSVEFTGPNGKPLPDDSSVGDAAWHGGFDMTLDGKQFPVLATRSGGYVEDEEEGGGRTELPSLLERGKVLRLRAALNDETRRSMAYAEFEGLCEDCGMDKADARKVAADLHKVGVILHFHAEPGLADIVYLQPHQVLEHFFAKYSLESPLRQYLLLQAERLEEQKNAVRRELAPTLRLKENLESQARVTVSRCMWGLSALVVSGAGGYWYLSYVYLSWDIMEPVTFFTALGVSTLSYAWWMFTNKDLQHSNIFDFFFNSMIQRQYEEGGLDQARLKTAEEELSKLDNKGKLLEARIFELECMRDKGITAAAAAGIASDRNAT